MTRKRREKVNGKVLTLDRTLEDALPHIIGLLGLAEGGDPLAARDSQIRRRRTHEALKRVLLRETLNQPLIVVFEDLHWIDEETQAFLNLFVDSIGTARLLLLVNYRPEYSHRWNSKTYYTQLRLDRLGRESADEMLDALLGVSAQAMDKPLAALKHLIIEKTDGNPLFMEELVEALFEQGMLIRDGAVKLARPVSQLKIPSTVQGILAARIDRLPAEEKELLQTLAVVGMEFPLPLAREVAQQPPDLVDTFLNNLQTAEFIYERPSTADVEYTFKHPLTRQIADESLLSERRKLLHQRVGQAIESLYAENLDDHYSELARHFLLGNDPVKALRYTRPAIEQLVSRFAYSQAANFIDSGLRLVGSLPDDRARLEAELWLRTIESMVDFPLFTASSPQRERAIRRMYELSEQLGEQKELLRAKINLSNLYFVQGESARRLDLARQCLPLAEAAKDDTLIADAHWSVAGPAHMCGALAEAVGEYDKAILCSDRVGAGVSLLGVLLNVAPLSQSCTARHLLGRISEAAALAEQGIKRARESGHPFTLGHAMTSASLWMTYLRREPDAMLVHAEEQIALFSEHGLPEWLNWGHIHKGMALADLGHVADGVLEMEKGIAGFGPGGAPILQFIVAVLALGYARLGRIDEAIGRLNEVLAHVERSGEKAYLPEIIRLKGEVILKRDPSATKDAEGCFRDSLEVARVQSARWWQLRTTISLAKLLRSTARTAEAHTMLADIYDWFTEGFDTADLKDAKALLDELCR
jgi:tetratricopeptide (TPR) repeat protein